MVWRIVQEAAGNMTEKEAYDIAVRWVTCSDYGRTLSPDDLHREIAEMTRRFMAAREEVYLPAVDPASVPRPAVENVRERAKEFGPLPHHAHPSSASGLTSDERRELSVTEDAIACLECGAATILLKTHLGRAHGMSAEVYRERWGLDDSFPFAPPAYSQRKRAIAAELGLGDTLGKGDRTDEARRRRAEERSAAQARRQERGALKVARDEARRRSQTMPVGTRLALNDDDSRRGSE